MQLIARPKREVLLRDAWAETARHACAKCGGGGMLNDGSKGSPSSPPAACQSAIDDLCCCKAVSGVTFLNRELHMHRPGRCAEEEEILR